MVHDVTIPLVKPQTSSRPQVVTASSRKDNLQRLLTGPEPTRLDFLKSIYANRKYSGVTCNRVATKVRGSSNRQYQSVWRQWLGYVRDSQPGKIGKVFMTNYFNYLFDSKHLAVSTIRSHKSALTKPLKLGFKIDLNLPVFEDLHKAMALERPAPAKKHIT